MPANPAAVPLVIALVAACASCRQFTAEQAVVPLPPLSAEASGLPNADWGRFPPVHFATGAATLSESAAARVRAVPPALAPTDHLLLAGLGDDALSPEWSRILAERRALAVRDELLRAGVARNRIQTASRGGDDWRGNDDRSGRVEIGVVK